ncbi:DUF1302 domain-containing protein [Allohahella sp. A8]|uniref:DUF1302 domain-containing protein n=1 Tax=Allohahella sp. A8 TaxID=3141461 RepID=UPI003A80D98B
MIKHSQRRFGWTALSAAIAAASSLSMPAQAFQFYLGDIEGSLDTTLTAGASWRVEKRDKDYLAQGSLPNYGKGSTTGSSTNNTDDGDWNYDRGKTFSKVVKGTTDLLMSYENFGGFTRLRYFYDRELMDESRAADPLGQIRPLNDDTLDQAGSDVRFLDAYVWGDFYAGEVPINVRVGRQVLSWGESTFILGGINSINPLDFSAARSPGAEVKDVLLPVNMLYTSIGVTADVTVEAFYQFEWEKTQVDPCGTFYSTNDTVADGCGPILIAGEVPETLVLQQGLYNKRLGDDEPDNDGMFGAAVRWYAAALGDTELGFFYYRTNSTLPYVNFVGNNPAAGQPFGAYQVTFPEAIDLFGISFSTSTEGGWSIGGEISHRPDMPVQKNGFELTLASLNGRDPITGAPLSAFGDEYSPGGKIQGYEEFGMTQAQVTFIKFFDQVLGASRLSFATELGATYLHGFPDDDESRFGRDSTFGVGPQQNAGVVVPCEGGTNNNPKFCENEGFTTSLSAGYRMRASLDYNDAFAGVNLSPIFSWAHDVYGYGPILFREGQVTTSLDLRAVYLNKYTAQVGYTARFGGEPYSGVGDRDSIDASVSVSF